MALQMLHEVAVLTIAEAVNALHPGAIRVRALWQIDSSRSQECLDAVGARLTIDVPPIVRLDIERNEGLTTRSRTTFEKRIEQLLPRGRMYAGGLSQHAIHIEENRVVLARR